MAQADQTVQNNTFPTVRADINNNLAALFSKNSGVTAPSTTVAYMDWIDTSGANPVWKKRNAANNAWITLGTISGNTIAFEGTLPSQSGNSGKYLTTNGTSASWGAISLVDVQEFTSNGTWTKPGSGTVALIRCWGGGGSGGRGISNQLAAGGGGGACVERWMKLSDLGATVTVTIGAGGIGPTVTGPGNVGGTTTFGSHVSAYGGGGGGQGFGIGGGGGGSLSAGSSGDVDGAGGSGHGSVTTGRPGIFPYHQGGDWGGGGGGSIDFLFTSTGEGGTSLWGGGGGGGTGYSTGGAGGESLNGGSGSAGDTGTAGGFPGGGSGGRLAATPGAGGAGYCIVIVY